MQKPAKQTRQAQGVATTTLKVRCDEDFKRRICGHAEKMGLEMSAWVRNTLRQAIDRQAGFRPLPPLNLDPRDLAAYQTATVKDGMNS